MAFGGGEETHQAAGADAADADDLHREVFQAVAIEQHAAIVGQRQAIVLHPLEEHLLHALLGDVEEHRRLVHQAVPAIDRGRQLGKQILADALAGLLDHLLPDLSRLGIRRVLDQGLHVQTLVPDVQRAPFRALAHVLPVRAHARDGRLPGLRIGAAVVAGRHGKARPEALDIPLPRRRQRFVEVVDVQNQVALRRGEDAEVQQMAVAARLYSQAGAGERGQVVSHQARRAAQEGERAAQHPPITDGDQIRHAIPIGLFQHADRVASLGRRLPGGVALARQLLAQRLARRHALVSREKRGARSLGHVVHGRPLGTHFGLRHAGSLRIAPSRSGQVVQKFAAWVRDSMPPARVLALNPFCCSTRVA